MKAMARGAAGSRQFTTRNTTVPLMDNRRVVGSCPLGLRVLFSLLCPVFHGFPFPVSDRDSGSPPRGLTARMLDAKPELIWPALSSAMPCSLSSPTLQHVSLFLCVCFFWGGGGVPDLLSKCLSAFV